MKNKKLIKLGTSLALVAAIGAGATLAYLSKPSNTVTNGFTVGEGYNENDDLNQAVWIDETKFGTAAQGELMYEGRTLVGNTYSDVLAGSTFTKDPILRVNAGSVKSYVFIEISGLDELAKKGVTTDIGYIGSGWTKVKEDNGKVVVDNRETLDGWYRYNTMLDPTSTTAATDPLFNSITVSGNFEEETLTDQIVIKGCAVQAVYTNDEGEQTIAIEDVQVPVFG